MDPMPISVVVGKVSTKPVALLGPVLPIPLPPNTVNPSAPPRVTAPGLTGVEPLVGVGEALKGGVAVPLAPAGGDEDGVGVGEGVLLGVPLALALGDGVLLGVPLPVSVGDGVLLGVPLPVPLGDGEGEGVLVTVSLPASV